MPDRPKSIVPTPPPIESAREAVWRQTFLAQFDDPRDRGALQRFGDLLSTLAFGAGYLGERGRALAAVEVEAVADDLDQLAACLQEIAASPTHSEVNESELVLCVDSSGWDRRGRRPGPRHPPARPGGRGRPGADPRTLPR